MELQQYSSFLQSDLQSCFCLIIFFIIIIFFFFFFRAFLRSIRSNLWFCRCDICHSYITSNWSTEFDNLSDWYAHLLTKSPTSTIQVHVLNTTITANPSSIEYILKTRFDNYPKGKPFSSILKDFLGLGIFNVDGEFWRFQRKMVSPELSNIAVRSYAFEIVSNEIKNRLLPLLDQRRTMNSVVDLQDVFRRFTFDTICQFTFGLDPECPKLSLPISEFSSAFDLASKLSAERALQPSPFIWKIKRLLNIGTERELKKAIKMVNVLAKEIIIQRSLKIKGFPSSKQDDLLSRFMNTVDDATFLRDIIISFTLAGRDSVSSALTSFFWLLAKHPDVCSTILAESDRVMGPSIDESASFEQTQEMPYLQAALYENMRLYPPVQFDSKYSVEDDTWPDGTLVKRGTRVTYHTYAMGRIQDVWGPDCREFRPERWLTNGVFAPVSPFKYPVFQAGIRVCLGKEMALMEMKCVAIEIIRRFEIKLADDDEQGCSVLKFEPGLTATLRGGLPVIVVKKERRIR